MIKKMFKRLFARVFGSENTSVYIINDNLPQNMEKKRTRFISLQNKYYQLTWQELHDSDEKQKYYKNIERQLDKIDTLLFQMYTRLESLKNLKKSIDDNKIINTDIQDLVEKNNQTMKTSIEKAQDLKKIIAESQMKEWREIVHYIDSYVAHITPLYQTIMNEITAAQPQPKN
jgi:hypothetical protein